jgi:diguanylate cyclase (GGDEF)-like protein/PAS domain S-box-containing protein
MISKKDKVLFDNMFTGVYVVDMDRKILYWNDAAKTISGYTKEEMINKHCYNNILRHVDENGKLLCFGGCPLEKSLKTGVTTNSRVYLSHKLGHRVPVSVRSIPTYNVEGEVDGAIELFEDARNDSKVYEENLKLQEMVVTDRLTKAFNRHFIDFYLSNLIEESARFGTKFGVLFMDIDHFKDVNDTYGHDVGDEVLKMISTSIMSNIRTIDRLGRWGGEEFVLICKIDSTNALFKFAEKIRMIIENSTVKLQDSRRIKVTISIGGLMYTKNETFKSLMKKADSYMYEAKETGRNKVIIKGD